MWMLRGKPDQHLLAVFAFRRYSILLFSNQIRAFSSFFRFQEQERGLQKMGRKISFYANSSLSCKCLFTFCLLNVFSFFSAALHGANLIMPPSPWPQWQKGNAICMIQWVIFGCMIWKHSNHSVSGHARALGQIRTVVSNIISTERHLGRLLLPPARYNATS